MTEDEALNLPGQVYRHYKGGIYRVLFEALHTETEEVLVIYEHLWPHEHRHFARPAAMFYGTLENGKNRFEPIRHAHALSGNKS